MNKGYTLLELLVAMTLSVFATLAITKFFITEHRVYEAQENKAEAYQTLRGAMNMFTRELILTGYGLPTETEWITRFDEDEIEFRTNLRNIISHLSSEASSGQGILSVTSGTGRSFEKGDVIIICSDIHTNICEEHTLLKDGANDSMTITSSLNTAFPAGSRIDLINTIGYRHHRAERELQRKIDRGNWEAVAENMAEDGVSISYRDKDNQAPLIQEDIQGIDITLTVDGRWRASATSTIILRNSL